MKIRISASPAWGFVKFNALVFLATLALCTAVTFGHAQVSGKAFEGFDSNSKDPIQITADELEIIDGKNVAIFKGRVKVLQGSSILTTDKLTARYGDKSASGGQGDIEKLEFDGSVVVVSGSNTATANNGFYDVRSDTVELVGKVVISQGKNIVDGCKLNANLKTNVVTIHACKGRVTAIITPGSGKGKKKKKK